VASGDARIVRVATRAIAGGEAQWCAQLDARERDHDRVIAIDVMTRLPVGSRGRLPSIVETLARASVIGSHSQVAARLADAELVIEPDVGTVGLLDFSRIDEIIDAGRRAARRALEIGVVPGL
jgi:NTE family protein